jgi:hypothetical protein
MSHSVGLLHKLSIPTAVVQPEPDAADLALLEQAEHLASIGFRCFVILSGDLVFAHAYRPTRVSLRGRLRARASNFVLPD